MFVPTARVRLVGMPYRNKKKRELSRRKRAARRNLKLRDLLRMPCLLPTCASCLIGFLVLMGGTTMSIVAYHPEFDEPKFYQHNHTTNVTISQGLNTTTMKVLEFVGPVFMAFGLFTMIVAGVLYCEFVDKYVNISTDEQRKLKRKVLYEMIIAQMRRNYFRGLEIPTSRPTIQNLAPTFKKESLSRCLSSPGEATAVGDKEPCPDTKKEEETVVTPTKQTIRLKVLERENWIKTSSLPNIKPADVEVATLDVVCSSTENYLMTKRLSKSCGNVVDMFSTIGNCSSRAMSSGFDNLGYTPDQEGGQTLASVTSKSSLHSVMSPQGHSRENVSTADLGNRESEKNKISVTDTHLEMVTNDENNSSSSDIHLVMEESDDAAVPKGKHATVIIHQAHVHQSAEASDLSNMQANNPKQSSRRFTVCKISEDASHSDVLKALPSDADEASEPLLSNHIRFDKDSPPISDCVSQSDGDEGESLVMSELACSVSVCSTKE